MKAFLLALIGLQFSIAAHAQTVNPARMMYEVYRQVSQDACYDYSQLEVCHNYGREEIQIDETAHDVINMQVLLPGVTSDRTAKSLQDKYGFNPAQATKVAVAFEDWIKNLQANKGRTSYVQLDTLSRDAMGMKLSTLIELKQASRSGSTSEFAHKIEKSARNLELSDEQAEKYILDSLSDLISQ